MKTLPPHQIQTTLESRISFLPRMKNPLNYYITVILGISISSVILLALLSGEASFNLHIFLSYITDSYRNSLINITMLL